MPLASETELRRPLGDFEIREGVAVKTAEAAADAVYTAVYEAVKARMEASGGRLYGMAYPSIKGSGHLHLLYFQDWRGETVPADEHRSKILDNHEFTVAVGEMPGFEAESIPVEVPVSIPELPPNAFRRDTGQGIPVVNGSAVEKRVKYVPRRDRR